jgi:methionyl-tRNA synthetase
MFKDKLFISSTLPYVNSNAHMGHCFEFVLADTIARYYRIKLGQDNVFFNTGVDEHGQKVYLQARKLGENPYDYCDEMAKKWKEFCQKFHISYDNFYRTTSPEHKRLVTQYIKDINRYIYEKSYSGIYCEGCEAFKTSKELIDEKCIDHPTLEVKEISEKNFFFKLSGFKGAVPPDILLDDTLKAELDFFVQNAEDISISRENVSWGIQFPDSSQTIYVWAEALLNYIFAAGYNETKVAFSSEQVLSAYESHLKFEKWWSNSMIVCGRDNLRFQALILPALLAAKWLPPPTKVFVHGIIQDEHGKKMSKSEGNVIDPIEQLEKFGLNPLRYYLVAGLNSFDNSSYSEKELQLKYDNDIANGYGNLLARTLHLIDIKNIVIDESKVSCKKYVNETILFTINKFFELGNLREAYKVVHLAVSDANLIITQEKPFDKNCPNPEEILNNVYYLLQKVSPFYQIVFPDLSEAISTALIEKKKVNLFPRLINKHEDHATKTI